MDYRKVRENMRAVPPIISVLLMIAIVVAASFGVYAWAMGYIGYQTGKINNSVLIQSVSWNPDAAGNGSFPRDIYLQNIGRSAITIVPNQCLYVNGVLIAGTTIVGSNPASYLLTSGETATIAPVGLADYAQGSTITIKVTTLEGTFSQVTEQVP
jgi:FlaG/FlaF family flagellin (archaellin)